TFSDVAQHEACAFPTISLSEVLHEIKSLNDKKAPGFDNINSTVIKRYKEVLGPILAYLFNRCATLGIYPNSLKLAKVIPIFKNGEYTDYNNYRPISLLPLINKIFEKCLAKSIKDHLKIHGIIHQSQFG